MAHVIPQVDGARGADTRPLPRLILPLELELHGCLLRIVRHPQHPQRDAVVSVAGVRRGVRLREELLDDLAGGRAERQRDLPVLGGYAGGHQRQVRQIQGDAVDLVGQGRELEGARAPAEREGIGLQRLAIRQAQPGLETLFHLRPLGPELVLRRQPLAADNDRGPVGLGQHLLHAQRHPVAGDAHRRRQNPRLLQVDEADAGHVAQQPLQIGPDPLRSDGEESDGEGEQDGDSDRGPTVSTQRLPDYVSQALQRRCFRC